MSLGMIAVFLFQMRMYEVDSTMFLLFLNGMERKRNTKCSERNQTIKKSQSTQESYLLWKYLSSKSDRTLQKRTLGANHISLSRIYTPASTKSWGSLQKNWSCELLHVFSVISPGNHAKGKPIISADLGFDVREFIIDTTTIMKRSSTLATHGADGATVHVGICQWVNHMGLLS